MSSAHPLQAHWDALDRMLRATLTEPTLPLSPAEKRDIEEFLDANEFGVAFSLLVGIIKSHEWRLKASVLDAIDEIGAKMNLDCDEWEALREFVSF